MSTIQFITSNGKKFEVEADGQKSVMQVALNHNMPGIVAECGGYCSCATCHAYIGEADYAKLPPADDVELSMLEGLIDYRVGSSRLTCQIKVTDVPAGMIVNVPENQMI